MEIAADVASEATIGVMVVDDQAAFRRVARAVVDATPGFHLIADAASGPEALRAADHEPPQLVLMDVNMPEMDGFEATQRLTGAHPDSVVVLVSLEDLDYRSGDVAACGAVAFLHKPHLRPATLRGLWSTHSRHR